MAKMRVFFVLFVVAFGGCSSGGQLTPAHLSGAVRASGSDSILYTFTGAAGDGSSPYASPIVDSKGVVYGVSLDGTNKVDGLVWKLMPKGSGYTESPVYEFSSSQAHGSYPEGGLIEDSAGALYGTGATGGKGPCLYMGSGCGVVFKLTPSGGKYTESILHDFGGAAKDGGIPVDALLLSGNELYGTTEYGGSGSCQETGFNGCGTVFEVSTKGSGYQVIYSFQGGNDGVNPATSLIAGKNGVLYGTTNFGGGSTACTAGCGTVFELTPKGGKYTESVLYAFQGGQSDGSVPGNRGRGLYLASNGSLVGTTHTGGSGGCAIVFVPGCGVLFELTPSGGKFKESILYTFEGGNDAAFPEESLVAGKGGVLYGASTGGGGSSVCQGGCGTVFSLTPSGKGYSEAVVYGFASGNDGGLPYDGVTMDSAGTLYGTTHVGGESKTCNSCGTVFSVKP
ncbi:MAG: choice-of-anchor tandem repeat GloVer-containing protein [Candidatus Cybelea sp.]